MLPRVLSGYICALMIEIVYRKINVPPLSITIKEIPFNASNYFYKTSVQKNNGLLHKSDALSSMNNEPL